MELAEKMFFLQSRACLMGWSGDREKEELEHLISEPHKGSAKKTNIRVAKNCFFSSAWLDPCNPHFRRVHSISFHTQNAKKTICQSLKNGCSAKPDGKSQKGAFHKKGTAKGIPQPFSSHSVKPTNPRV